MKNCSCATSRCHSLTTRAVSAQAAMKVTRLTATFSSGAQRRAPKHAEEPAAPAERDCPGAGTIPCYSRLPEAGERLAFLERLEMMQIEAVELLADLEEEDAEDQHRDEHIERDAKLDDHRHAVGGAHGAEEQSVLHRQEAHHLRHRLAPRDHGDEGEQDHGHGDADGVARGGAGERGDRLRETEGKDDDQQARPASCPRC